MAAFYPLFLAWSLLLGMLGTAVAQQTQQSSSFQAGPNLLPGSLHAETINNRGSVNLMLSVLHADGSVNGDFSGPYTLTVNGESTELTFSQGYCNYPLLGERFESIRLDYWNSAGPQYLQYGFHTQGTRTRENPVAPWTSILPPILAIALALIFREVIGSLLAGVVLGTLLLIGFQPEKWWPAITGAFEYFILHSIADSSHASIILFSLLIGAMVAVISRNGGMYGVVEKLSVLANSARNAQLVTWFLGIAIFFDDYANTLVVGNTMRPVTDRFRVSREKLAYLVDSTAAPVAAIAFITTWIGAELDYISGAISTLGLQESAYGVFLSSLSYSFYPYLTLIFMLMLILSKRDFGFMYKAEIRARSRGQVAAPANKQKEGHAPEGADLEPRPGIRHRWSNAFFPVATVIFVTLLGLWITGFESLRMKGHSYAVFWENESLANKFNLFFTSDLLSKVIGGADSYVALIWASASGLLVAAIMSLTTRTLGLNDLVDAVQDGFKTMLPALTILVLAWSLAAVTNHLHTAGFLSGLLTDRLNPLWLPAITFIMAGLISFSTGSSWSTMAILYPIILPLTYNLSESAGLSYEAIMPIFHNVTAMVLAGSVFGDHCSPISDTTILSSLSTNCNHVDHVRTQLPYALTVGAVSVFVGGVLSVIGIPAWINLLLGIGILFLVIRYIGKPVPDHIH
ncbi:MAG: Na+/H+ antiporter NhaC family protein [Bacteroidetes bacterium]|nr:Na+/H+ antiporter NhaC family protein [Bacteroidota bacterium]